METIAYQCRVISRRQIVAVALAIATASACGAPNPVTDVAGSGAPLEGGKGVVSSTIHVGDLIRRPLGVPPDYVVTPFGLFHPTCFTEVPSGSELLADGTVVYPNGATLSREPCGHAIYDKLGRITSRDGALNSLPPPQVNGWVESGRTMVNPPAGYFNAGFLVPNSPPSSGALIYIFPALQDSPLTHIIQPVLRWWFGWTGASWHVDTSNNATKSADIAVNPGDDIVGAMSGTNCNAGTGVCSNWQTSFIHADTPNPHPNSILFTTASAPYTDVIGGALEAYVLDSCSQLPAAAEEVFDGIMFDVQNPMTMRFPSFSAEVIGGSPSCSYDVTTPFKGDVTLHWSN
ncbi:MAG TPA: hypothetical protein VK540_19705 [Polyangiaceae bacterium]|nr:hypothetical protein [Polyangiaceae bacterium]